ncbi:MAG: hypothetical protein AB1898_23800 [Acidobacteriota bacterium]
MKESANPAPTVMGEGNWRFQVIHDWGELPGEVRYGNTHGVAEDSAGNIYVFHTVHETSPSRDAMVVFNREGQFVTSWGSEFAGGAHGLHLQREGDSEFLYLCDIARNLVVKTTLEGREVLRLGYPSESEAYQPKTGAPAGPKYDEQGQVKYKPTNVAVAPNGDIYVADGYGSHHINRYTKEGQYLQTFGGPGQEPGQLMCPHGIMVDTRAQPARVLVADRSNNRLQYFSLEGEHLGFAHGVELPCHFAAWNGMLAVPDLVGKVTLLDQNNQVLLHLGTGASDFRDRRKLSRDHFLPGKFVSPHSACFDRSGDIFVVEWVEIGRVSKLVRLR